MRKKWFFIWMVFMSVSSGGAAAQTPSPDVAELVGEAKYIVKHAKEPKDYLEAVAVYKKVIALAPGVGAYHYNLGLAQELAGQPEEAIQSYQRYLATSPSARDAAEARERIGGMKYASRKAAQESSPEAVATKAQQSEADWFRNLDGARYGGQSRWGLTIVHENALVIRGHMLGWRQRITSAGPDTVLEIPIGQWYDLPALKIEGRRALYYPSPDIMPTYVGSIFTISEDGSSITEAQQASGGGTYTYLRQ